MATLKTQNTSNAKPGVQYHIVGAHGNHVTLETAPLNETPPNVPTVRIGYPSNYVLLTQQNAADLAPMLSSFGSTGVLS